MALRSREEINKYGLPYYSKLISDTFKPDGSFATEWATLRISHVLTLLGKSVESNTVLDIGCGIGTFTSLLSGKEYVIGVDFSKEALRAAKFVILNYGNRSSTELIHCDVQFLPIRDDTFDQIVAADLVEHLYPGQYINSLLECSRVLKKNGILATYTPNPINLASLHFWLRRGWPFNDPTHVGLKSPFFLFRSLMKYGFKIYKLHCVETSQFSFPTRLIRKIFGRLWVLAFMLGGRTCIKAKKL